MKGSADSGITETETGITVWLLRMVPGVTSKLCTPKFETGRYSILTEDKLNTLGESSLSGFLNFNRSKLISKSCIVNLRYLGRT